MAINFDTANSWRHQTSQTDYDAGGYSAVYSRSASYNAKGQLGSDYINSLKSDGKDLHRQHQLDYSTGSGYALGAITFQSTSSWVCGSGWLNVTNGYFWYDGALQSYITRPTALPAATSTEHVHGISQVNLAVLHGLALSPSSPIALCHH